MPKLLYITASHDKGAPLDALVDEIRAIRNALSGVATTRLYSVEDNPAANREDIFQFFTQSGADIRVFHYAGHARQEAMHIDGGGHIKGIAELFGLQRENGKQPLQLVFINGCSSAGMVHSLHNAGVGAVIATVCPIGDTSARVLANTFYQTWASEGKNLQFAFEKAVAAVHSTPETATVAISIQSSRDFGFENEPYEAQVPWGLYLNPELTAVAQQELLNWQLNPPVQLSPLVLDKVEAVNSESLRKVAFEFCEKDADARRLVEQTQCSELMALITRLPWTVGSHLRRLFAVDREQTMQQNKLPRLREIVCGYTELTRFICYTAFSALWDDALRHQKKLHIELKTVLYAPDSQVDPDYFALLLELYRELDSIPGDDLGLEANMKKFIDEVSGRLSSAYQLMERIKQSLPLAANGDLPADFLANYAPQGGLDEVCRKAEAIFAQMIKAAFFLTDYTLFSVRAISVDKVRYFNLDHPFVHKTMTLHAAFSEIKPLPTNRKTPGDNYSILLAPRTNIAGSDPLEKALNLSPFYIDKHAMIGEKQDTYPAIYVLTNEVKYTDEDTFSEEIRYKYLYVDHDVNHQYLFEGDHQLQIAADGLQQLVQPLKPEEQRRFSDVCRQIEKLKTDFQPVP